MATPEGVQAKISQAMDILQEAYDEAGQLLPPSSETEPEPEPPTDGTYLEIVPTLDLLAMMQEKALDAGEDLPNLKFEVVRHRVANNESKYDQYIQELQPGDWIEVQGVTLRGKRTWSRNDLSACVKITFDGQCSWEGIQTVKQDYAYYFPKPQFVQMFFEPGFKAYGGLADSALMLHGAYGCVWDGYHSAGSKGNGFSAFPASDGRDVAFCVFRTEVEDFCQSTQWDPHAEKGSGVHGANVGDAPAFVFHHNLVCIHSHDPATVNGEQIGGGSVIQIGGKDGKMPHDNELWVKGENFTWNAQDQQGGNCVNFWASGGAIGLNRNIFHLIEGDNMSGHGVNLHGTDAGADNVVEKGRANNCMTNPRWDGETPWVKGDEIEYLDVVPA